MNFFYHCYFQSPLCQGCCLATSPLPCPGHKCSIFELRPLFSRHFLLRDEKCLEMCKSKQHFFTHISRHKLYKLYITHHWPIERRQGGGYRALNLRLWLHILCETICEQQKCFTMIFSLYKWVSNRPSEKGKLQIEIKMLKGGVTTSAWKRHF